MLCGNLAGAPVDLWVVTTKPRHSEDDVKVLERDLFQLDDFTTAVGETESNRYVLGTSVSTAVG